MILPWDPKWAPLHETNVRGKLSKMSCQVAELSKTNCRITKIHPRRVTKLPRMNFWNTKAKAKSFKHPNIIFLSCAEIARSRGQPNLRKPNKKLNLNRTKKNYHRWTVKLPKFKSNEPQVMQTKNAMKANLNRIEGVQTKTRNQTESSKRIHLRILLFHCVTLMQTNLQTKKSQEPKYQTNLLIGSAEIRP